jgi:hypothetical protein
MITVKFSCAKCGLHRVAVQVPARESSDPGTVVPWVNNCARICAQEHSRLSPGCNIKEFSELMIPNPKEAEFIGQQIE